MIHVLMRLEMGCCFNKSVVAKTMMNNAPLVQESKGWLKAFVRQHGGLKYIYRKHCPRQRKLWEKQKLKHAAATLSDAYYWESCLWYPIWLLMLVLGGYPNIRLPLKEWWLSWVKISDGDFTQSRRSRITYNSQSSFKLTSPKEHITTDSLSANTPKPHVFHEVALGWVI